MTKKFSLANLFPNFHSSEITNKELERIVRDAVQKECPKDKIKKINYTDNGIDVILESGNTIEIEVDWQEIILI